MKRSLVALALLCAVPLAAHAQSPAPDYHDYQALLDRYCIRVGAKGQPVDTRFDYEQLYMDERIFARHLSDRLTVIHAQIFAVAPSQLTPNDRIAWGLNAYNFLVIERATMNLLVTGHGFQRYKSVDEMQTVDGTFFGSPFLRVEGRLMTLQEFERFHVFGDSTEIGLPRRKAVDPRLMFATCSGHAGDAPLPPRVFRGDSLEAQLDQVTRAALALPRIALLPPGARTLQLSDLVPAHLLDFGGSKDAMLAFVERYAPPATRKVMRKTWIRGDVSYRPSDAALNQYARPKPKPPAGAVKSESSTSDN